MILLASALFALIAHELGHIAAALLLGVQVKRVGVNWKGVFIVRERGSNWQCAVITLSGPALNLAFALVLAGSPRLALAHWAIGLVNLIPFRGSDGNRFISLFLSPSTR